MTTTIRNEFRVSNVTNFISSLSNGNNLYLGISRPEYWNIASASDAAPSIPQNNCYGVASDWEEMMQMKLISPSSMSNGMFKEIWAPNTAYDTFRHDWNGTRASVYNGPNNFVGLPADLSQAKYYVITSAFNIYICLKQSVVGGVVQASTQNPDTGTPVGSNTGVYSTSDGYLWKFIAVTTPANVVSFSTNTYHPASTIITAPGSNDPYFPQWTNQLNSANFKQGVYVINVTAGGSGYNSGVSGTVSIGSGTAGSVTILGNGINLVGTMTFGSGGTITNINITNPGSGYTYMSIAVTGGSGFTYDPIFTPSWGLGADPVQDLSAYYAIINSTLNSNEGPFTVTNDYRKICLVYNPTTYSSSALATTQYLDATWTFQLQTGLAVGAYTSDEVVYDSATGAYGRVVDFNNTTGVLRIIRTSNENAGIAGASAGFAVGSTVAPGIGIIQTAGIKTPTVQAGSGHIIYVEYRSPIARSLGQSENISLVVEF
jgi:hypothetical protein